MSESIAPLIRNIGTRWANVSSFATEPLYYLQGKSLLSLMNRGLGRAQSRSARFGEKFLVRAGILKSHTVYSFAYKMVYSKRSFVRKTSKRHISVQFIRHSSSTSPVPTKALFTSARSLPSPIAPSPFPLLEKYPEPIQMGTKLVDTITVIPRLTKIIRSGITFVSRNLR